MQMREEGNAVRLRQAGMRQWDKNTLRLSYSLLFCGTIAVHLWLRNVRARRVHAVAWAVTYVVASTSLALSVHNDHHIHDIVAVRQGSVAGHAPLCKSKTPFASYVRVWSMTGWRASCDPVSV